MHRLLIAATFVALLIACGSGSEKSVTADAPITTNVLDHLKSKGLPVGEFETYTTENDPNKLLGRPGQYIGKLNFHDTRLKKEEDFDTDGGGSVEVFGSDADAANRAKYMEAIAKTPMFNEYDFREGRVLLRLSSALTPDQARQYQDALRSLPK